MRKFIKWVYRSCAGIKERDGKVQPSLKLSYELHRECMSLPFEQMCKTCKERYNES